MKKHLLLLPAFLALFQTTLAQQARTGSVELNKNNRTCLLGDYPVSSDMVEGALKKKFNEAKLGSDKKASDGFRLYKGVLYPTLSPVTIDLYVKIEEKKPNTTLYILASKGYDNFLKPETDTAEFSNGLRFLNQFANDVQAFKLNADMKSQQELIADAEEKNKSLQRKGEQLSKSKSKTESKIALNKMESNSLKSEVDNQQKNLDAVRARTATIDQMEALKKEIGKQEEVVKKATKKYESSVSDGKDLADDLKETEEDIIKNNAAIEAQSAEIKKLKDQLENLKQQLSRIVLN